MPIRRETRSRALALQLLYAWDAGGAADAVRTAWSRVAAQVRAGPMAQERALALAEAVLARREALDERIASASERWRPERLGIVDRNVLRIAIEELEQGTEPPKVVIHEAVRLARWFGGEKSPSFVNGVLDRVARDLGRL